MSFSQVKSSRQVKTDRQIIIHVYESIYIYIYVCSLTTRHSARFPMGKFPSRYPTVRTKLETTCYSTTCLPACLPACLSLLTYAFSDEKTRDSGGTTICSTICFFSIRKRLMAYLVSRGPHPPFPQNYYSKHTHPSIQPGRYVERDIPAPKNPFL